jgi:predicted RNA-binding protein
VVFGQTDQKISPLTVIQHSAITLSWAEVKVLTFFLRAHLAGHEAQVGRVVILPDVVAPVPSEMPRGVPNATMWKKAYDAMNKLYEEFMRENPESAPALSKTKHQ